MEATFAPITLAPPANHVATDPAPARKNEFPYPVHPVYAGHMLSMIAFDGMITINTHEAIFHAQDEERKATGGRAGLWQGFKNHAAEGQVRSRNECAWQFLKSPCEFHDLLDTDLMPTGEHFKRLRAHPEARDSIICAPYYAKQQKIQIVANFIRGKSITDSPRTPLGLVEIAKGGTGFMQIPRSAYERVMRTFGGRFYYCDYDVDRKSGVRALRYSFFAHTINKDAELGFMRDQSEDWWFCDLARRSGVKIYLDTSLSGDDGITPPTWHRGPTLFPMPAEMERLQLEERVGELEAELAKLKGETTTAGVGTVTVQQ